jgi:hypothetical protein
MLSCDCGKRVVSLMLVVFMIAMPLIELSAQETNSAVSEFTMGQLKGESDAKGQPLWFLAGLGCGIIGVGVAYFVKPNPPAAALLGQSSDYVLGYTDGFKKKSRDKNVSYACVGWGVWIVIYVTTMSKSNND